MSREPSATAPAAERPIDTVRGTRDWLPSDHARLAALESLLLDRFARAGYEPLKTPVLEFTELHERKSGAGIVAKLFELSGTGQPGVCLRPELTAGIVRAYTAAAEPPPLPWRVSHSGPVFRYETPRPGRLREFQQVGVERLGDSGPLADGEVIWLADWALAQAGVEGATIRLGHVGLILEMLERSGLPAPLASALIEMLSEAAADGRDVRALERGLEQLSGWLQTAEAVEIPNAVERADDAGIDRLFRTLVPVVTGRRSGHEIVHRLRRKWDLSHGLLGALERVRAQVHDLAELKGHPDVVLARLARDYESSAPESVAALRTLVRTLSDYGVGLDRVELDLGFGRGIGFYSQMIFELLVPTPEGTVEVCGGGRYDGLARVLGSDRDDRGVGFAFGLERLAQVLEAQGRTTSAVTPCGFLVLAATAEAHPGAAQLATRLRNEQARAVLSADCGLDEATALAKSLGLALIVVVTGSLDSPNGMTVHDLVNSTQSASSVSDLVRLARAEAEGRRR
ncbi:HisS family protein [Singulisphaera sp. Ch08]|uniref:Histidine--tRNA ligase n=1 Tax=Singulisphaera sp. Ch08 TaxID=3120278 RepID=A0AAU7CHR9_9BACT